jgi:hypothetical protein
MSTLPVPIVFPANLAVVSGGTFPVWFTLVYVVGFLAAVAIGSIAWYNSKRPAGWEDAERPDYLPTVPDAEDNSSENSSVDNKGE